MELNRAKEIIVSILQAALSGHLDPSSNINPRVIAEAIAAKVEFEKEYTNIGTDKIVGGLIDIITTKKTEMQAEYKAIKEDEKVLRNFINGKITAYDEILEALNTL